jgi:hypothetical protein
VSAVVVRVGVFLTVIVVASFIICHVRILLLFALSQGHALSQRLSCAHTCLAGDYILLAFMIDFEISFDFDCDSIA